MLIRPLFSSEQIETRIDEVAQQLYRDYAAFEVESGWVVGYGMDVDGEFRDLDEIGIVSGD